MARFQVLRQHDGDKQYYEGDVRTLSKADAANLVRLGVLEELNDDDELASEPEPKPAETEKAAPKLKNKAEPPVSNKALD
ncbi:hypothetical protein NS226_06665 [Aureimonas ureilytica]|uniref:Uncharacterized protein n=1 Tax=Aureimonas ureilytica TaxID=401562 RepID=A0A175RA82_9HYPH|nr:hypothetical protein [Aureimonas ureilytica]KTQ96796.1 hypothetical protein NS226_06665 [Aureimonas ureilytica]